MLISYLATPYSHQKESVMQARYEAVTQAAAWFYRRGKMIWSPITHTHPIKTRAGIRDTWEDWAAYDLRIMAVCNELLVLTLPGWQESVGVQAEIAAATGLRHVVRYVVPEYVGVEITEVLANYRKEQTDGVLST